MKMKKFFLTLLMLVAATATMAAQDLVEQTEEPVFELENDAMIGAWITITHYDEDAVIYYRYSKDDCGEFIEWTDWLEYDGTLFFTEEGNYCLEATATVPGKTTSDVVSIMFTVFYDPSVMYYEQIADFGVDGIYYKHTSDSTVCVSLNSTYTYPYVEPWGWAMNSVGPYSGDVVIPETVEYDDRIYTVDSIDGYAFMNCQLASISLPNTIRGVSPFAFFRTTIESGSLFIPASVTNIEPQAFKGCCAINEVRVDENNPVYDSRDNCNAIIRTATNELAFGFNSSTIPSTVTAIGYYAFGGEMYMLGCTLTDFVIPNSIVTIGDNAFFGCQLSSVEIPNSVITIGNAAFGFCGLFNVNIPNSVTSIGDAAFAYNPFENVVIGNSVTSIGESAFEGCNALKKLTISNSVTSIGHYAFAACSLENVISYAETPPVIDYYTFDNTISSSTVLFVPAESIEVYRSHSAWREFMRIVPFIGAGPGDIDGSGSIDVDDVVDIISMILDGTAPEYADVNGDGSIDIDDITVLINMLLNGH